MSSPTGVAGGTADKPGDDEPEGDEPGDDEPGDDEPDDDEPEGGVSLPPPPQATRVSVIARINRIAGSLFFIFLFPSFFT